MVKIKWPKWLIWNNNQYPDTKVQIFDNNVLKKWLKSKSLIKKKVKIGRNPEGYMVNFYQMIKLKSLMKKLKILHEKCEKWRKKNTWMLRWSLWWLRQREQRGRFIQSKQYILHSDLCESAWNLHWTKKFSWSIGFNHGGHFCSSSSGPPAPYIIITSFKILYSFQKKKS